MKKALILLLILCFTCTLLFGCNAALESTVPTEAKDPIWGKGYAVEFNAYTSHSGHPSSDAIYCLTTDKHFVYAAATWEAKLEIWDFDPAAFTALFTDTGYWQGDFRTEYICQNIDKAWKGEFSQEVACYLLQLKDGMLMVAMGSNNQGSNRITSVQILKEKCTQAEYLSYWNDWWLPRQFEDNKEPYQKWRELYNKYK